MIGSFIALVTLLAFCALLYAAAVYAVPVVVGLWVAFWAMHVGAGEIGGFAIGIAVGALLFITAQVLFKTSRTPAGRWLIALVFALPAGYAGFSIVEQIGVLVATPTAWQHVIAVMAGAVAGVTAIKRISNSVADEPLARPD